MSTLNIFEQATRQKLRFESTTKAALTVEDLWDIPLTSSNNSGFCLDVIAQNLHKQLNESSSISFVRKSTKLNDTIQLKFDVVKHIIDVKLREIEVQTQLVANEEQKKYLDKLIENKQIQQDSEMDLEALLKKRAAL